jgi:DNA-3-methyladenine glycosylase II
VEARAGIRDHRPPDPRAAGVARLGAGGLRPARRRPRRPDRAGPVPAARRRGAARLGAVEPAPFLTLDDGELRTIGFSRQKTRYARLLAESLLDGSLDLGEIAALDDDTARSRLTALTGIGPWTADVYLVMALRRPDAFPAGDLALQIAAQEVKRLPERPTAAALELLAEAWRPHRATAARLLWLQYLASRGLPL